MPVTVCRVVSCAHNLGGYYCNAAVIEINDDCRSVAGATDCGTFLPREFAGSLLSLENVNYSGLVAEAFSGSHCADPEVHCLMSDCTYNDGAGFCASDKIEILSAGAGNSAETSCGTYCRGE